MRAIREQKALDTQGLSRRDFLKLCSLTIGGLAIPHTYANMLEQTFAATDFVSSGPQLFFQWQNEFLCKTIYPMREVKLRDFLIYYQEVDIWSKYKDKDISAVKNDVDAYKKNWETNASAALKEYTSLREYFMKKSVRSYYPQFWPIDEAELAEIDNLHVAIVQSWPQDIRNERSTVEAFVQKWELHRDQILELIKTRESRHLAMDPPIPSILRKAKN